MKAIKLCVMAQAIALAMILSFVECQIPAFIAVPGVKIGLANIAIVFALYTLGFGQAIIVSIVRVFLVSVLFGNVASLAYGIAGTALSLGGMVLLKKSGLFGHAAVSVTGGVLHNVGQILMACLLLETNIIRFYLPVLVISGVISGFVIGLVSADVINRLQPLMNKERKHQRRV